MALTIKNHEYDVITYTEEWKESNFKDDRDIETAEICSSSGITIDNMRYDFLIDRVRCVKSDLNALKRRYSVYRTFYMLFFIADFSL